MMFTEQANLEGCRAIPSVVPTYQIPGPARLNRHSQHRHRDLLRYVLAGHADLIAVHRRHRNLRGHNELRLGSRDR